MRSFIEEAIREHWGERCPDFEPGCPCCRAWAEFDKTEQLRAALERIADTDPDDGTAWFHNVARAALEGRT